MSLAYMTAEIPAKRKRTPRPSEAGPTVFTLARKAEILHTHLIVPKHGKPKLAKHQPSDAVDCLAYLRAMGKADRERADKNEPTIGNGISEGQWMAGERLMRLRLWHFKHGVTGSPSIYRAMVSSNPEGESADKEPPRVMTVDERYDAEVSSWESYDGAMLHLARKAGYPARDAVHSLISCDWWPESQEELEAVQRGLRVLALFWKFEKEEDR